MNNILDEMNALKTEIENLKDKISQMQDGRNKSRARDDEYDYFENRLGITAARLIRSGPESAAKSFLSSSRIKSGFLGSIGLGGTGFIAGLASGLWSFGISMLVSGIAKLFTKQRSQLLKANAPESYTYFNSETVEPYFMRSIDSELFRGRSARLTMRERTQNDESLERQIMRGVVGL